LKVAWVAVLLGALLLVFPRLASAEPRIALIIANSNYKGDIGSLKNPVNDGKLIGEALKKVGFNVRLVTDGDQTAMKKVLNGFSEDLAKAGSGATGLAKRTGQKYRLPSEREWEYAARAGTKTARYWGETSDQQCSYANGADQTYKASTPDDPGYLDCNDGFKFTAPVGTYKPNAFGLYDMLGNSFDFTQDCLAGGYDGQDHKGAVVGGGSCEKYVIRGASWGRPPNDLRSAKRTGMAPDVRSVTNSLRLVREL
jgi:hypothetical protein